MWVVEETPVQFRASSLFCSSVFISAPAVTLAAPLQTSSPADPWWSTLSRVATLRHWAASTDPNQSHLVEFSQGRVTNCWVLDGPDVAAALLLSQAHPDASSLGFIATQRLDDQRFLRAFTVVDRVGPAATGFWDGENTLVAAGEASGLFVDLLRRVMGVSTPPFARSTEAFWLTEWLVRAALSKGAASSALSVETLVALHPNVLVRDQPMGELDLAEAGLACTTGLLDLATARHWPDLRRSIVEDRYFSPVIRPALASWFDDGSLGRWCWSENFLALGVAALQASPITARAADLLQTTFGLLAEEFALRYPTPLAMDELLPCLLDD